ncbi:hypothetical protein GMOD_00000167 [Pyrenophora seminiperda CCB06]|uniref:Uncharacterized protein n=1 Tax=Pyrenophora seminiperda CCB06 TaxID=1302712 RepID=A0A3M7M6J5_9PLEO|nr:hypothetical protein GMOD_00000167 [Pyrenophora seminiperda CCB06]
MAITTGFVAAIAALSNKPSPASYSAIHQLARFDNLSGPPVAIQEIGQYLDLFFQGIYLVPTLNLPGQPGVKPNTPSNMAGFNIVNPVTLLNGPASMTTNYPDSTVDFFDFESLWFGCVLPTQETIASLPVSCVITISGFSDIAGTRKVAEQKEQFRVDGLISSLIGGTPIGGQPITASAQMVKAEWSSKFRGLRKVVFAVDNQSPLSGVLSVALLDTMRYTVWSKSSEHEVFSFSESG